MNIQDILDRISDVLDTLLQQLIGTKHTYTGKKGNPRKLLKQQHKKGNALRLGNRYLSLESLLKGGLLLLGKSGSGKSSKLYAPTLLSLDELEPMSMVCMDISGQGGLRDIAGGYTRTIMEVEDVLNFSNADDSTVKWNFIDGLKPSEIHPFSMDLVATLSPNKSGTDPIWNNLSATLISCVIRVILYVQEITGLRGFNNLYNVRFMITVLQGTPNKFKALISRYSDDLLYADLKAILANNSKFLNSVISNTLSVLALWQDENVIRTTSSTNLEMESYRHQRSLLWIQTSITQQERLSGLHSLFFKAFFNHIMDAGVPSQQAYPIVFLADEMSAVRFSDPSYVPFLSSQLRKYKSMGVFGYQSYSQCIDLYTKEGATTLRTNAEMTLYLGKQDLETATHISKSLGKYSYKKGDAQLSREVMTPQEVLNRYSQDGGILCSSTQAPTMLKSLEGYYQDRKLQERASMPTPHIETHNPMPALLPIDDLIADILNSEAS